MNTVTIPVMAKARIGHFAEAQILQALGVDYIDESEVLTLADEENHINKSKFDVPFVCGCRNLGEALRRVSEGAAMIRTKGEAVCHLRQYVIFSDCIEMREFGFVMCGRVTRLVSKIQSLCVAAESASARSADV